MSRLLLTSFVCCVLGLSMNPVQACVVRQAALQDVVDEADALVVARVVSVDKKTRTGRIPFTSVEVRVTIEQVLSGKWEPVESQFRHTRHKAHKRGNKTVCPLHFGSGLELKLKPNRSYLMLLAGSSIGGAQLIRAEPLSRKDRMRRMFETAATREREVEPGVWTLDVCKGRILRGPKKTLLSCLTKRSVTRVEPEGGRASVAIQVDRFASYSPETPIQRVYHKGAQFRVYWSKESGKPHKIFIEGRRKGRGTVVVQPEGGEAIEIQVEVKPSAFGF